MLVLVLLSILSVISAKYHAAFVFAGSARSFTEPFVHESIRFNLIHLFCPPKICNSVIFARVSLSDNVHQVDSGLALRNGSGIALAGDLTQKPKIEFALSRLIKIPYSKRSVPLVVSWADVGGESEKRAIASEFPSFRHRFFNQFDARRYSMYYNRYKSYEQVLTYENEHEMQFNWVIHARLDFFWGESILPIVYWMSIDKSSNHVFGKFDKNIPSNIQKKLVIQKESELKVWVPDTWWSEVPDTFALIPRNYSNAYFDLNALVADKVMCLGGPNIDQSVASETELIKYNYTQEEIQLSRTMLCVDEDTGGSEQIIKRKLKYTHISLSNSNLGYSTFFTALIRPSLHDVCMYVQSKRLIGWVFDRQYSNNAVYLGCYVLSDFVRYFQPKYTAWPTASVSMGLSLKSLFTSTCVLDTSTLEYTGSNCLLDKHQTDW